MKNGKMWKRLMAAALCSALVLTSVPAYAKEGQTNEAAGSAGSAATEDRIKEPPARSEAEMRKAAAEAKSGLRQASNNGFVVDKNGVLTEYTGSAKKVTIPSTVKKIGDYAFFWCETIEEVVIPDGVTYIGEGAFEGCDALKKVTIPKSVKSMGDYPFMVDFAMEEFVVDAQNEAFASYDGCLYTKDMSTLEVCPTKKTSVKIPFGVNTIQSYAFNCGKIKSVELPASVTTIGYGSFQECVSLKSIVIPPTTKWIMDDSFWNAENLTIYGTTGSYAQTYAKKYKISFKSCTDSRLVPASYEFDGTSDMTFSLQGIDDFKEFKGIAFSNSKNVQADDFLGAFWELVDEEDDVVPGESFEEDIWSYEDGVVTCDKEAMSHYFYNFCKWPLIGNTYQGALIYLSTDGTKKTVYGDWFIKVLADASPDAVKKNIESCTITVKDAAYTGKERTPAVTVKDENGCVLTKDIYYTVSYANNVEIGTGTATVTGIGSYEGSVTKEFAVTKGTQTISGTKTYNKAYGSKAFSLNAKRTAGDGKLTYACSNTKVAAVNGSGKVTVKGTGAATITVKAAATSHYNAASIKVTIKVSPAKQTVKSVKTANGKKLTVKWKKDARATGYQIQYSTKQNFSGAKTKTITKSTTTSKTLTGLSKGKKYYVRVRAYKTAKVNGKSTKLYGAWSSAKRSGSIK